MFKECHRALFAVRMQKSLLKLAVGARGIRGTSAKSTASTRGYAEIRGGTRRYPLASGTFIQKHLCQVRGGTRWFAVAMVRDDLV